MLSGIVDTGGGLNIRDLNYHESVEQIHSHLYVNFEILKYLPYVKPFNILGVDENKYYTSSIGGVYLTSVNTYGTSFVVNGQQVEFSIAPEEGVA